MQHLVAATPKLLLLHGALIQRTLRVKAIQSVRVLHHMKRGPALGLMTGRKPDDLICFLVILTVWHSAVALIWMRTSPVTIQEDGKDQCKPKTCSSRCNNTPILLPGPGGATVTVVTSKGFLASQATAARHSIGFPAVGLAIAATLRRLLR
jgi:hypothetical protein